MLALLSPHGRIGRGKWWLVGIVSIVINYMASGMSIVSQDTVTKVLFLLPVLATFWIMICNTIHRYHDVGKSGWWILIGFIPIIGAIWQLIELGMIAGDEGDNRFGPPSGSGSGSRSNSSSTIARTEGESGVDLSKFDAAYFAERAEKMSSQNRVGIPVTANRSAGGPVVFGKR